MNVDKCNQPTPQMLMQCFAKGGSCRSFALAAVLLT
jgi:hypothetical protein